MTAPGDAIRKMFHEVSLGAPENAVGFVLWRLVARYQREADRELSACGITNLQFTVLTMVAWFGHDETPVTQIALSRFGGIQPMQVSQTLRALEAKDLIARRANPSDARVKRVLLTGQGLRTLRRAMPKVIEVQRRLFGEAGRPGGRLLETLLRLERSLPAETAEPR